MAEGEMSLSSPEFENGLCLLITQVRGNRKMAVLVVKGDNLETDENEDDDGDCLFEIYRPNTGHQKQQETQNSLQRKFYKVTLNT